MKLADVETIAESPDFLRADEIHNKFYEGESVTQEEQDFFDNYWRSLTQQLTKYCEATGASAPVSLVIWLQFMLKYVRQAYDSDDNAIVGTIKIPLPVPSLETTRPAQQKIPNSRWVNIGNALVKQGHCLCNINKWPDELTPDHVAAMTEMMIFDPQMQVEARDYNPETGIFKLMRVG